MRLGSHLLRFIPDQNFLFPLTFCYFAPMLKAVNIHKSYGSLQVLRGVNMELGAGEIVSLVGSSGAGKSTLLQIMGTLDFPDQGEVVFNSQNVTQLKDEAQANFRNQNLGFVFQFHHLLPEFNALENVAIPGFISGKPQAEVEKRAKELLDYLGLSERLHHKPTELSGGEQQRVAMARALINEPQIILADEPTGNLDSTNSDNLYELIFNLKKEFGVSFLIATHNEKYADMADRTVFIKDGLIVDQIIQ